MWKLLLLFVEGLFFFWVGWLDREVALGGGEDEDLRMVGMGMGIEWGMCKDVTFILIDSILVIRGK